MKVTDEMAAKAARILNERLVTGNLYGVSREMLEAALALEITIPGQPTGPIYVNGEPVYSRADVQKWRNDALENAAEIARRYGADDAAHDIMGLVQR